MKKIINVFIISVLFASSGIAQNTTVKNIAMDKFTRQWIEIQFLQEQGLPKSLLPKVDSIYQSALAEKNYEQVLKAIIFQVNSMGILEDNDDAANKIFNTLKNDAEILPQPAKSVIYSMIAQMYEEYYNLNRWKVNERTYIQSDRSDVKTLDARSLAEETIRYYELSIQDENSLQNAPVGNYGAILQEGANDHKAQPTLFDLLINRALKYYDSEWNIHTLPQQAFVINDERYFSPAEEFVSIDIQPVDSLSPQYLSLKSYQRLLRFHLEKEDSPEALINNDLQRISYLKQKGRFADNEKLYENALIQMGKDYEKYDAGAQALLYLADYYYQQGDRWRYDRKNDYKSGFYKAYELAETIRKKSSGELAKTAESMIKALKNKELEVKFESVQLPNKPFLALMKFRNIGVLYQTVYKLTEEEALEYQFDYHKYGESYEFMISIFIDSLKTKPTVSAVSLPKHTDFQRYTTEIKIDPKEKGFYLILFSDGENALESDIFNANLLQVSTLAAQDRAVNGEMSVLVTDRTIGAPISNATVQLFEFEDFRKIKSFITDKNGIGKGSVSEKYVREYYAVNQGNNRLLVFDKKYNLRTYDNEKRLAATILTDRAIYRPGQTIYFKAILYSSKDNDQRNLLKNTSVKVRFYDANHQIISEKSIKSNDFGSLDDVFVIPQGLLNGQFLIECENYGSTSVRVEEYKRPTFEVKFDTVRENYKLNDLVKVQLNAQALAGYSIDNANVQYRVTREVQYRYFRWWYPPVSDTREIGSGVVKTDEDGKTSIEFQALADDVKNDELIYTYTVTADVTDVNGETRTGTLNLNISNKPLLIKTNVPNKLDLDNLDKYTVETTNLNGDATPATVAVEIVALKTPDRILRNRLWNDIIDFQMIPEKEFRRDFPLDAYNNELNPDNFAEKNTVSQWTMDTEKSKKLDLSTLKESGYYKLILSAENRQGITIADTLIFNLTGKKAEKITAMNEWITALKTTGEPGENAEFLVAGGNVDSRVYYEVIHKNKPVASKWIKAGTTPTLLTFPIKEEYRGGFSVQFSMTQENRIYSFSNQINVLFTNKMLDVKLATFRDKLLPGENEKWTMLVSDKKGEKQVAEIAASLYDASLDVFAPHSWANLNSIYNQSFGSYYYSWNTRSVGQVGSPKIFPKNNSAYYMQPIQYVDINWFNGLYRQAFSDYGGIRLRSARAQSENVFNIVETAPMLANEAALDEVVVVGYGVQKKESMTGSVSSIDAMTAPKPEEPLPAPPTTPDLTSIQTRTNFNETAFFYPQLRTNENGEVLIEFTIPEALTRWKLLSFAHTQDFKIGTYTNELITQKQVAISANPPRFFRENDEITLTAKVNNLTESDLDGQALLRLYDAVTMQPVDDMIVSDKTLPFNVKQGGSEGLQWKLKIPAGLQAITYKVTAQAGTHSDGEEKTVPVLTNSMLVTETMPFSVRAGKTKSFTMDKLIHNQSNTLRNYNLTLEYTSAPAWYAVQALPYIMEYPYECAEQTFARYYANTLATTVVNKTPRIKQIFDTWNTLNSSALLSNLEKNQELKQVMLEETPWVMQAKNETESKKRIGLLFDLNRMSNELNRAFNKLKKSQNSDGGFPWFDGNPSSRYITQHIVAGMAHLDKLGAMQEKNAADAQQIVTKGLDYLDNEIWKDYDALIRNKADLTKRQINALHLNYLYACSFDRHKPANDAGEKAFDYYLSQTEQFWIEFSTYEKAMAALILNRFDKQTTAKKIMASLKEYAQQFEEMGMYWKDNVAGYFWYQAPIETQAILIEAFNEVTADIQSVEEMKIWLLRNKQTNDWKTTKATSEAVYALLMTGGNLLDESKLLEVEIGGKPLEQAVNEPINPEAGTGYVKTSWQGKEITPQMGKLTVKNPNNQGIGWGGLYWQYFEQLDKITSAVTNLKMNKQLFLRVLTEKGEELKPIDGSNRLHVGDLVRVRMELRADRDFEYVHLKDMRAAGFEPVSTVSGHRYQDGLFYYESVKDASNNYFITYLRKGTYVFEYDLRVSHEGDFSNGITTFQCMYAPEFSAHSEGIRVKIE